MVHDIGMSTWAVFTGLDKSLTGLQREQPKLNAFSKGLDVLKVAGEVVVSLTDQV